MQYFDADFLGFFRELAANNEREWFKARKTPAQVLAVREAILDQRASFERLLVQPAFEQYYPAGLQGEKHKRIPKQFRALGEELPMIYQKQYYFMRTYEEEEEMDEILQSKELLPWLLEHFEAAMGINRFLREALVGE